MLRALGGTRRPDKGDSRGAAIAASMFNIATHDALLVGGFLNLTNETGSASGFMTVTVASSARVALT